MKRLSISKQLLTLFVPFLFGLWIASAVLSYWLVSTFAGESFDRDLINSADSVVGRLRVKEGKIVVDLPPAAQAILKRGESDKFYYRVLASDGQLISGDSDLPMPSQNLQVDVPKVVTAAISGKNVRLAEIKASLEESEGQTATVQVAETTNVRRHFQETLLMSIAVPQLLVIILGLFTVWYGITKILTPLKLLRQQVVSRSQFDLSALSDDGTPEEVYPLVRSLNHLLNRLNEGIKAQQWFMANAAHQLRTPLAGLKTYSSIGGEMSEAEDLKHIINKLDQGIDRAGRMVAQLLALARIDSGDSAVTKTKSPVDLNLLVSDVVGELVEQALQKNIELTYESSWAPSIISGEETGLRNMVTNLVENAILYTSNGGKVLVCLRSDGNVGLCVLDTGCGIPVEEHNKVFERFYRVEGTSGDGSGLGLAIVKEVADAHDACVSIRSGINGRGTMVLVEFPIPAGI
jgi:two-component system, OmpR family, sensor histidine kinase TctE